MSQSNNSSLPPLSERNDIEEMARNWKAWLRSFKIHIRATGITDDGRKVAILLDRAGKYAQAVFYAIAGPQADEKTLAETIALFDAKFERKPNLVYERSVFSAMKQRENETVASFQMRLTG